MSNTNYITELTEQLVWEVSSMFSGSAYIVDELDTTTRSFLEKNLHLRDTYFDYHLCLKLVDNYVRSFERISESYSDLC